MKPILLLTFTVSFLLSLTTGQEYRLVDSKNAKIVQEARYLQGGTHGSAYIQDDGTEFKEETDADGTRKGSYSYIDDTGKKIAVQYTAGKMGFMVTGDHLPQAPQPVPQGPPAQQQQQQHQQYRPEIQGTPQYTPNSRFNTIAPQQGGGQGQFAYNYRGVPNQGQGQNMDYNNGGVGTNQIRPFPEQLPQVQGTTPPPHRYFPPGKLNLNRTPDGFQYSFSSK